MDFLGSWLPGSPRSNVDGFFVCPACKIFYQPFKNKSKSPQIPTFYQNIDCAV